MTDWQTINFFTDESLVADPYPYFDELRSSCPVLPLPHLGVVAVTGYDEVSDVYRDTESFSSCNSVVGPYATFPVPLEGDDVRDIVARYRDQLPLSEHMVTMDPPDHTRERGLLMRLLTPKRLKGGEDFMQRLADQQLDEFVATGQCEFIGAYAQPFAMLVVANVLGVPEEDHQRFRAGFGLIGTVGKVGAGEKGSPDHNPLAWLDEWFSDYIEDRRRRPQNDVLTELALATYPDGSTPEITSVLRTATFLFAAGQETTARLLAAALKHLAEHPELQNELRANRGRIPDFLEEVLRVESPVKTDFRLASRSTSIGGVDIVAGTPVMLLNGAANRDPRRFECPNEFRVDRANAQSHIAFGRGAHSCPGGPWLGQRAGSALSASWTGRGLSACPRSTTALPVLGASATSRPGFSADSPDCILSSSRPRPVSEPWPLVTGGASGTGSGVPTSSPVPVIAPPCNRLK